MDVYITRVIDASSTGVEVDILVRSLVLWMLSFTIATIDELLSILKSSKHLEFERWNILRRIAFLFARNKIIFI